MELQNQYLAILIALIGIVASYMILKPKKQPKKKLFYDTKAEPWNIKSVDSDFNWESASPLKSYPFKNADYKLTMGIRNLPPQDWLLVESTYKQRLDNKRAIIHDCHPEYPNEKMRESTVFKTEEAIPAIKEFYDLVIDYMCKKYPMHFELNGDNVINNITGVTLPRVATGNNPDKLLDLLAEVIEEDFIILLKDPTRAHEKDGEEYFFKAGIFGFAAGFNPKDRFNKPLSFVHHPIPGYESKLKLSMNRFFNRLSPGQLVTRLNFSVQTHHKLYVDNENKGHNLPEGSAQEPLRKEDLDFENEVHYRSERQALTKLPNTGAVIFTIRTYLLPMATLKQEPPDVRERLVGAIKGFPEDIKYYKRAGEWGPAVIDYLSEGLEQQNNE